MSTTSNPALAALALGRAPLRRTLHPSFSEKEALPGGAKPPEWFALEETRPLALFAGI